jgi:hypothetical protein
MLVRLLIGLVKGLVVGGLVGFAFAKLGFGAPGALMAYFGAALAGSLVGLIAGKPVWAAGAKIEVGLKAAFGALVGMGLMWLARSFVKIPIPLDLGDLTVANASLGESAQHGTIGGLAITSLALVAGLLGGFYDADNTPEPSAEKGEEKARVASGANGKARIGAKSAADDDELEDEAEPPQKRTKR